MFAKTLWRGLGCYGIAQSMVVLRSDPDEIELDGQPDSITRLDASTGLSLVRALRRDLIARSPDVVLAHGGEPLKYAVLARGRQCMPRIIYRKIGLSEQWLGRCRWFKLFFQRWLVNRADAISAVGAAARREAIDLFHADPLKVRVIYRGVDFARFLVPADTRGQIRDELGIATSAPVLIAVGALGWEKNLGAMLRILREVKLTFPDVVLLLVGDGPERARLNSLASSLGVHDAVHQLGTRRDIPNLLAAADLVLLTSLTEGVPGVLIEAGMAGRPCVTWDVAGAAEVVEDGVTGRVTPYLDESAFAHAVISLLSSPKQAAAFGHCARSLCRERFGIARCVDEHLEMMGAMVDDNPNPNPNHPMRTMRTGNPSA